MSSLPSDSPLIPFDNTYALLGRQVAAADGVAGAPSPFFVSQPPQPVQAPILLRLNRVLAQALGLDAQALAGEEGVLMLAGNRVPAGAQPLAMAYAGHQFGHWVAQLGDGRAVLLGEFVGRDGIRRDLQLKGSGVTPFSRNGDGRSALGPVIREYIVSEAMAGLGIPTTRALAMVRSGEQVLRQWGPEPGGVLTRVAQSHVRVGTFQYFLGRDDQTSLRALAGYVIERHYPELAQAPNPAHALLLRICEVTAMLIARWQLVGFIHGVMNTDNMSVVGETLDFGPCAFMDAYHPDKVFSSIDRHGRYAWSNQPPVGAWNMARLADTLLAQMAPEQDAAVELAREALSHYGETLTRTLLQGWRDKLGLATRHHGDEQLVADLLQAMASNHADFTRTFRALCEFPATPGSPRDDAPAPADAGAEFDDRAAFDAWADTYRTRLQLEQRPDAERRRAMRAANPRFIARNHLVERVIQQAYEGEGTDLLDDLLTVLASPFDEHPEHTALTAPPTVGEEVKQTFCGT
jgi:uncharacterized protein YdiU (UPF0061 family)